MKLKNVILLMNISALVISISVTTSRVRSDSPKKSEVQSTPSKNHGSDTINLK